jgi:DNA primase
LDLAKRAIRESSTALVVEGYFDVVGAVASGVEATVATMGTALTEEQTRLLSRFSSDVVVGYDGDEAGEQAFQRALPLLLSQGLTVRRARFGKDQDPDSLRTSAGPEAVFEAVTQAEDAVLMELDRLIPPAVHQDPRLQARAGKQVSELLRSVRDSILRYSYSRKAADRLGVPVEILLRRVGGKSDPEPERPPQESQTGPKLVRSLEEQALQLLLVGGEELPPPGDLPAAEVFLIPACRNIYRAFCDLYKGGEGRRPAAREVLASVPLDSQEVDQMARLLLEGSIAEEATGLSVALGQLNRRWLQQCVRALSSQISEAQRAGDEGRLRTLLEEKTALSRALHGGREE